jgi:integrase
MKIVKSDTGNLSVRYKDAAGEWRSTNLRTKDRREANRLVKELKIQELEDAGKLGVLSAEVIGKIVAGKSMSFGKVVEQYIEHMRLSAASENSIYTFTSIYDKFAEDFKVKDKPIGMITEKMLYDFLNAKDGTSASNRSLRKSSLSQLYNFAMIKMYVLTNPLSYIKVDKSKLSHKEKTPGERKIFHKSEVNKLLKNAPYFFRQAVALSYWAGLRLGDICSLEWDSIKDRDRLAVWTEKRDKLVLINTTDEMFGGGILKEVLSEIDVEDKVYCFPTWHQTSTNPKTRSKPSVYFTRLCERLEIYDRSFHCLRHTCITRMEKQGISLEEIGKAVGHSSTKTTQGYVHK